MSVELDKQDSRTPKKDATFAPKIKGIFVKIMLFFRQVINEMQKVVYPTRDEVTKYTAVVLVFVLVLMLFITAVDFGIGKGITKVFS
jgi:preprotein translocase subunit SecE